MRTIELKPIDSQSFAMKYGPWAVIAGASEGTGSQFAAQLAKMGINVVLVSRRRKVLEALGQELAARHSISYRALELDLMQEKAGQRMLDAVADLDVGLYVSNAGSDGPGGGSNFLTNPVAQSLKLMTMNVRTVIEACHGFGSRLGKRGRGGIIIMSSISAFGGQPSFAVYAATKAFEFNFAESLWAELRPDKVDVLGVVTPGVDTPTLRRTVPQEKIDDTNLYSSADVVHASLAELGQEPWMFFPTGLEMEEISTQRTKRRERLAILTALMKGYARPPVE
jgi:uncharacterized protein